MELLHVEETLTDKQDRTTLRYPFTVPDGIIRLRLELSYSPTEETDMERAKALIESAPNLRRSDWRDCLPVKNHLTLSLDDPNGFRGNAHRKSASQRHFIGETEASPGFYPGKILPGTYMAQVHLHALVTRECQMSLRIEGDEL